MANDKITVTPREQSEGELPPPKLGDTSGEDPTILSSDLRQASSDGTEPPTERFDLEKVYSRSGSNFQRLLSWALPGIFWLLRNFCPNLRIGKLQFVSRYHDVREVLDRDDVFEIPFDHKMRKIGWEPGFLLGMQDSEEYQGTKEDVYKIFKRADLKCVRQKSSDFAYNILKEHADKGRSDDGASHGRIDAVRALIRRVPTLVVEDYYGVEIKDKDEFEDCLIALSGYLFGRAGKEDDETPAYATDAYARVHKVILDAVKARQHSGRSEQSDILGRLLHEQSNETPGQGEDPRWTDDRIVSYLFGMILGFLPTNLMANGNILEALMKHKLERAQTRRAALDDDDALLCRCLFETMRRRIPLNPGPWRRSNDDYVLRRNTGRWDRIVRKRTLPKDMTIWPLTQSAMRDSRGVRRPRDFDPDRSRDHNLVFGDGLHHCIGRKIAEVQITQTMKALLSQDNLRRARGPKGRMRRISMFPLSQTLDYDFRQAGD